jgi:acetylornithine deacetylase
LSTPAAILRELVAIPTVSSQSNRALVMWLQRFFEPLDWHQRVFSYTSAEGEEKLNLIVSPEPLEDGTIQAELAVVCHTDTVPYTGALQGATELREENALLHGCGACDVKGFLACMLVAASEMGRSRLTKRLCLIFTSDEEIGCRGARFLFEQKAIRARYAIVGEPTSLVAARAGKGYCLAKIEVFGKAAHSAFPEAGSSAIFAAARLLREIEGLAKELTENRNQAFSPPWTTLNVGEIHGGTAKNIVPSQCSMLLEWRPVPDQQSSFVLDRVRNIIEDLAVEDDRFAASVEVLRLEEGFETSAESPVVQAVLRRPDAEVRNISFGTEAPWMAKMGAEAVVIGPGSMLTAHSPRECVPIVELNECVERLLAAITRLCG